MTFSKPNRSDATFTSNRTPKSVCPFSGMCATCSEDCIGLCEIGKSAFRGTEIQYPQPFGTISSASEKDYPVDYSHFNIMGSTVGAHGIEADSDVAIFPNVSVEREIGPGENKIKVKLPIIIAGMGSTNIAHKHWDSLGAGAAISGVILVIGENVVGMDPHAEIKNGRVVKSPNLEFRVRSFMDFYEGYGTIALQGNVEDTRLGVPEYAIQELGVEAIEIKWGQGAKDIGGEVNTDSLERALQLKRRGYIVIPDPEDPQVQEAYIKGAFKEFERHSRVSMVEEESFHKRVEELRKAGAKYIFLKTGAFRPADLARAVKYASDAKIDLLTVDGAGGGTGMSPWRMMNEWGIPMVELHSLLYQYCEKLAAKGKFIPHIAVAGGFVLEDQIFKGLALGAPYFKLIGMARAPLTAAFVGRNVKEAVDSGKIPRHYSQYGKTIEQIFITASDLKNKYGSDFEKIPAGALGIYTYFERIKQGLRQFMCGARKCSLDHITRDDIAALTREAAEVSGVKYIMELDKEEAEKILEG
ncbi:MAG: FMN-binding glutamate synthase family protein [Clostridia bacterium]|nr:FMN-binding glutamate synthase family protein [Clostridia bacterium]